MTAEPSSKKDKPRMRRRPKKWMVVGLGAVATAILTALWIAAE